MGHCRHERCDVAEAGSKGAGNDTNGEHRLRKRLARKFFPERSKYPLSQHRCQLTQNYELRIERIDEECYAATEPESDLLRDRESIRIVGKQVVDE